MATTILTLSGTLPQSFTTGNWPTAAFRAAKWHLTWTPTNASSHASYQTGVLQYWALVTTNDPNGGGLWLEHSGGVLTLFIADDASGNPIAASRRALTWTAALPISITVDPVTASLTVAGATTGNGTSSYTAAAILGSATLGIGIWASGGFGLPSSTFGTAIDDAVSGSSIVADPGAFAITGTAATLKTGRKIAAAAGSVAITGTAANLTYSPVIASTYTLTASAGAVAVTGTDATFRRHYALTAAAGSFAIAGTDAALTQAGALSIGAHGVDFQVYGHASRDAAVTLTTLNNDSIILVVAGGQTSDVNQITTDNKSNTFVRVSTTHDYPDYAGYGVSVQRAKRTVLGGSSHTFTVKVALFNENTTFAIQITGGKRIAAISWKNVANASGSLTHTSDPVTTYKAAALLAFWWGSSPVFSPSSTPFTATASGSFVDLDHYLVNNSDGQVQAAMAGYVENTPGTYTVTWSNTPSQGAQIILIAIQTADVLTADAGAVAVTGTAATLRVGRKLAAASGSMAVAGTDAVFRLGHTVTAAAGSVAITGTAAALRATRRLTADPGSTSITGTAAALRIGHVLAAETGAMSLAGTAASLRVARRVSAGAGAVGITGTAAGLTRGRPLSAAPGAIAITGTDARLSAGKVITAAAGATSVTGTNATLRVGRRVVATPGSIAITGTATTLARGAKVTAQPGAVAVTSVAAGLAVARRLSAGSGSLAITGAAASLRRSYTLSASPGAAAVAGTSASLRAARRLSASAGAVVVTGTSAELTRATSNTLVASPGAMGITGSNASLRVGRRIAAEDGAIVLVASPASALRVERKLYPATAAFVVAGTSATLRYSHSVTGVPARVAISRTTGVPPVARTTRSTELARTTGAGANQRRTTTS